MSALTSPPEHCATYDSGLGATPFQASGASLTVEMRRLATDLPETTGPEEMLAILEGNARIVCPDETHELKAGQGILIPASVPHRLEVQGSTLIYRVKAK